MGYEVSALIRSFYRNQYGRVIEQGYLISPGQHWFAIANSPLCLTFGAPIFAYVIKRYSVDR